MLLLWMSRYEPETVNDVPGRIGPVTLPRPKICLLYTSSRFGQDNPNHIFVPTDEPAGHIEARVRRTA